MWSDLLILMKAELILAVIIFILLFVKVAGREGSNPSILSLVNFLLLLNLLAGFFFQEEGILFDGMFHSTKLIILEKNVLNLGILLISLLAHGWLRGHRHVIEFYILLLSSLMGMFFTISSGNLLMFYLGFELSTIPLAALVNFDLQKRRSSEAAMKLIISSAFSSGLLLFGISLVYGTTGSLQFDLIAPSLDGSALQVFAFILVLAGLAFKVSAVPFHFWTADVYEGAPVAITAYLSVVSKGAFFFVLSSVLYTLFKPIAAIWYQVIIVLSVLTMIVGNLFALRQTNLKRLLAFSSIAQAGFIMVGISGNSTAGTASVIYFILVYIFSNLGAFAVIAFISSRTGKEHLTDYKGLYKTNPFLSWVLAISVFSLAGIPPTAGFFGKFFLLIAGAAQGNYVLITIAALNMVLSLYYYLVIIKAIFMDANVNPVEPVKVDLFPRTAMIICLAGIIFSGITSWVFNYIFILSN